jgi:hypothetical protein
MEFELEEGRMDRSKHPVNQFTHPREKGLHADGHATQDE